MPEGFHHEHKAKGYAIATDLDDGKPGAYDLPPPTTAGAIEPVKDKEGNIVQGQQEGDKEKWVDRTGWAPRFGNGVDPNAPVEESLLDHQTWVEGQLPDKLYGGKLGQFVGLMRVLLICMRRLVSQHGDYYFCLFGFLLHCRSRRWIGLGFPDHGRVWHVLSHIAPPCEEERPRRHQSRDGQG